MGKAHPGRGPGGPGEPPRQAVVSARGSSADQRRTLIASSHGGHLRRPDGSKGLAISRARRAVATNGSPSRSRDFDRGPYGESSAPPSWPGLRQCWSRERSAKRVDKGPMRPGDRRSSRGVLWGVRTTGEGSGPGEGSSMGSAWALRFKGEGQEPDRATCSAAQHGPGTDPRHHDGARQWWVFGWGWPVAAAQGR